MSRTDLPNELLVASWMSPPEHWVTPDASVDEAFAAIRRAGVRHLLVLEDDQLVGVVTDRDLRRPNADGGKLMSITELYKVGENLVVRDVMSNDPQTVEPSELTSEAARVMVENKFDCLPVVLESRVIGILTSSDLLAALVHEVDPEFVAARELAS